MSRKVFVVGLVLVLLSAVGLWLVSAQEEEAHPIVTTSSDVVGVGTYVAAQAFATVGTEEHPEPTIYILPYAIHPNMHVLSIEEFEQPESLAPDFTFEWALEGGELVADGGVAIFLAETEGEYLLTLTATDANGNTASAEWKVVASTYVGVGIVDGSDPVMFQCATCHKDQTEGWQATGHADMLTRALEGTLSNHYSGACISCHTTGYGMGDNGGFDDLAAAAGWEFPAELGPGVWDAFVAEFPEVAELANIQCESCHGPGAAHTSAGMGGPISSGLDYGVCAQCHAEDPYHIFPQQWENSAHGNLTSRGWTYPVGEDERACVRCHSGEGFIDFINGVPFEELRVGYQPITCAVCHDPHNVDFPNQLRSFETVTLPNGEFSGFGPAATCMNCHNANRGGGADGQVAAYLENGSISMPHHNNNQSELIAMTGGYTWGETLPSSPHGVAVEDACIGCHMASSPGVDAPGHNEVGGHSFAMVSEEGVENVDACQSCHFGATSLDFEAARDYDGDGMFESNQEEIAGLREILSELLVAAGIENVDSGRGFTIPEGSSEDVVGAFWNYQFTLVPGTAAHNLRYAVSLLQLSIEKLGGTSGDPVPGR